jgi:prephenate dehydrogenase
VSAAIERVAILGTGLIGASIGLALRARRFGGAITGWDRDPAAAEAARRRGAVGEVARDAAAAARGSDVVVLAMPVHGILDGMEKLAPALAPGQLLTDVGSTKRVIAERAAALFGGPGRAGFLPGHPMAGKETAGAAAAEAELFRGATWLFCAPVGGTDATAERAAAWRGWVERFGCRAIDVDPARHDVLCAWASHVPQMAATALAAVLEDEFGEAAERREELRGVGGRALREMTRLGASPYSMWRDIAHTNAAPIAAALEALEQRLAAMRRELTGPGLREEFARANRFRKDV